MRSDAQAFIEPLATLLGRGQLGFNVLLSAAQFVRLPTTERKRLLIEAMNELQGDVDLR